MFKNRKIAAMELAMELLKFKNENPLILAIPRGGVELGYYIANELECEWSVIISRKLGYPKQPEAAFGALGEDKSLYFNPNIESRLSKELIENVINKEEIEIQRRIKLYRDGASLPDIQGRTVIIVDDGIATGATIFVTVEMCKKAHAKKIIITTPVANSKVSKHLLEIVDELVVLETPFNFFAVSQVYQEFTNLSDTEVLKFLKTRNPSLKLANVLMKV